MKKIIILTVVFFTILSFQKSFAQGPCNPNDGKFLMTFFGKQIEVDGVKKYLSIYQVNIQKNRTDKKSVNFNDFLELVEKSGGEVPTMELISLAEKQGFNFPGLTICFDQNSKIDSYGKKKFPIIDRDNSISGYYKEKILEDGMFVVFFCDIPSKTENVLVETKPVNSN